MSHWERLGGWRLGPWRQGEAPGATLCTGRQVKGDFSQEVSGPSVAWALGVPPGSRSRAAWESETLRL